MLSIKEIKTIVKELGPIAKQTDLTDFTELQGILLDKLFEQTKLKSIEEVSLVLSIYDNTKTNWLKKGLENVLLYGEFPVTIKEVTKEQFNKDDHYIQQPIEWPDTIKRQHIKHIVMNPKQEYFSLKKTDVDI